VQQLLLYSGTQQIAVDGAVDFNGTQSLVATVENLQVGPIADLVGYRGLGGTLSGTVDLTGPATAPVLDSRLRFDVRSEGEAVGTMRLRAAYDSLDARLDGTLTHTEGSTLRLQGDVPVDLRLARPAPADLGSRPVRLDLEAEQFALDWVDPFVAPSLARDVRGALTARATMRGTRAQPDLEGRLTLRDGRLMVPRLGLTYREIDADALLDEDEVRLTRATMASTSGSAQAEGVISLADLTLGEYDLSIRATNFTAIDTREYDARVDSDLSLRGTTRRPALSGDLTVETGEVIYTADSESELASVQLSERDQQVLEQRFGLRVTADDTTTFSYYEATAMDLNVEIERNTWLRSRANPKMDIQFSGNLNLAKEAMDAAQVFGTINVVTERSRIEQLGKVFQIEEGALTFNGPMGNPSMNIRAVYEPEARESQGSEVRIVLDVSGRPDDPRLDLSAEPPMETKDIISYVATGRPAENVGGGSGGFSGGAIATDLVFGQASSLLENFASAQLGLDVARVKVRPDGRSIIAAGQYLTPRFYTAVELPISRDARSQTALNVPDITLEYELTQWLLARVQRRNSALQLNFLIEYAY
jgi:translocation and assembly module TamB